MLENITERIAELDLNKRNNLFFNGIPWEHSETSEKLYRKIKTLIKSISTETDWLLYWVLLPRRTQHPETTEHTRSQQDILRSRYPGMSSSLGLLRVFQGQVWRVGQLQVHMIVCCGEYLLTISPAELSSPDCRWWWRRKWRGEPRRPDWSWGDTWGSWRNTVRRRNVNWSTTHCGWTGRRSSSGKCNEIHETDSLSHSRTMTLSKNKHYMPPSKKYHSFICPLNEWLEAGTYVLL